MKVARGWHLVTWGWWWWYDGDDRSRVHRTVSYHVDVTTVIWPAWRFSVCKWVGCVPTHGVRRGWRIGLGRTKRAAEWAVATLESCGSGSTPQGAT